MEHKKINRLVTSNRQQIAQLGTKQFMINHSIPNEKDLDNFVDKNNPPLYINEQKTTRWFTRNGLQLPYQVNQSSGYFNKSIPNEKDLDKFPLKRLRKTKVNY